MFTSVAGSMRWRTRVAVVALGLLALTACKKDDELAGFGPRGSAVDVAGANASNGWMLMRAPPGTKLVLGLKRGAQVTVVLAAP